METGLTRRAMLAASVTGLAGCSGAGTTTPTPDAVDTRTFPDSYYRGPLVSAHEHMSGIDGSVRDAETLEWYTTWMARNGVDNVMAITPPELFPDVKQFDDSLIPFLFSGSFVMDGRDGFAERMIQTFEENELLQGFGEIGVYAIKDEEGMPMAADAPQLLDLYDYAAEQDVPVMLHAAEPWRYPDDVRDTWDSVRDCPTYDQMAAAYEHNRDTDFLVHGTYGGTGAWTTGERAAEALERHPNLWYDVSAIKPYGFVGLEGESMSQEKFERKMAETGVEHHTSQYYVEYEAVLENHSDRVLWGMDAGLGWNYSTWALDVWIDVARSLLGRLDDADARNVGYRTAEDLFGIEVDA